MIVVVNLGLGNLGSVLNMLAKIGAEAFLSSSPDDIGRADKLILPGVGAFDRAASQLDALGLREPLRGAVIDHRTPVLGICLGMQLLTAGSEEGSLPGLGWIGGGTQRFRDRREGGPERVPHMGWNSLAVMRGHPLLDGLEQESRFYFVHSYHVVCRSDHDVIATTHHGYDFTSVVGRANILGVQFHPEKSHRFGMRLLRNFAGMPAC